MKERRYRTFGAYLKERYGCKVSKVTISAGFTCPNRDGRKGSEGCIYCNNAGFNPNLRLQADVIQEQVHQGIDFFSRTRKARKFIVYFQPYTNTYAPIEQLKPIYDSALISDDIIGISIGTRPDCIPEEALDLVETYTDRYMVWLEIGLQSMHERTLDLINRGHDLHTFIDAIMRIRRRKKMLVCSHIIHGLPGESREEMMQTVRLIASLGIDGIKFHNLHVLKDTPMERMYHEGKIPMLTMEEYCLLIADSLELLPPEMLILRLSGDAPKDLLIAPEWCSRKFEIQEKIDSILAGRGTKQGSRYSRADADEMMRIIFGERRNNGEYVRQTTAKE